MPRSHGSNWVGAPGAAAYLGTLRTLYRLIDQDGLPAYRVGRVIRLRWDAIDAFLDSKRIQPGELRRHLYPQRSLNTGGNVVVGRRLAGEVVF